MESRRFQLGVIVRLFTLVGLCTIATWMITETQREMTIALCGAAALGLSFELVHFLNRANRELARLLRAIAFDDASQTFSELADDKSFQELGAAMTAVQDRFRQGRQQREEQARNLQSLISHIPIALISITPPDEVQLLNLAARRLFEISVTKKKQFERYGLPFATYIETLQPGTATILRMERSSGSMQVKAAAKDLIIGGVSRRIISLQNIENEMNVQELSAWQTVISVMAHEVMNSLTPVSSLAVTSKDLVQSVVSELPANSAHASTLIETMEALEVLVRRSEGLLNFVQNHRRITRRMKAQPEMVAVQRVFARLQRLLTSELAQRQIRFLTVIEPERLEVLADSTLLDQALINLVRNAIDALQDNSSGYICVHAHRDVDGRVVICVTDNGPGIPVEDRERVFVPFYSTKKSGSGVGLTLVRQIATAHGASVELVSPSGGGATVRLRF